MNVVSDLSVAKSRVAAYSSTSQTTRRPTLRLDVTTPSRPSRQRKLTAHAVYYT